ncbi:MAG: TetR/AcrR family transcriptional regulator [Novosphingobium sp.]|nr:TetR/AcrR family transcriptional regulator [Novosphingobium sp.]
MPKTAALPRRESNKARTRGAILRAAAARFSEKSISDATMDEIAEQAKVSRATLFNYFPSKAEIVGAIVEQMDDGFIAQIDRYAASGLPVAARVEEMFRESGRNLENHWREFRPLVGISEQGWGEDVGARRFARLNEAFRRLVHDVPAADLVTFAEVLTGTYIGIVHNWRFESDYPLEERLVAAARLVMRSLQ